MFSEFAMTISTGDIAFVRMATDNPDSFSFVAINALTAGDVMYFTDNGWLADGTGFRTGEGVLSYTVPTGGVARGTVVSYTDGAASSGNITLGFGSNANPANFAFSTDGDQIIAFTASSSSSPLTTVTNLIAAINLDANGWDSDALSAQTSALPGSGTGTLGASLTDLTEGLYSVSAGAGARTGAANGGNNGEFDNSVYTGPTSFSSPAAALAAINNRANWTGDNTAAGAAPTSFSIVCYVQGTLIRTPAGERAIETLVPGDLVATPDGDRPIRWIGTHTYATRFLRGKPMSEPVCIKTGALGESLPMRDLWVSPWHAILFGSTFARAIDLVNGVTITQDYAGESVTFFNIELDSPDVIFAEGVAAETYANHNNRALFQNVVEYERMWGSHEPVWVDDEGNGLRRFPLLAEGSAELAGIRAALLALANQKQAA
jgi:hypothetical protein